MEEINLGNLTERPKIDNDYYRIITRKISGINKRMLNSEIIEPPLQKLEKEALRGSTTDRSEIRPKKKPKKKLDLLSLILKSEHKIDAETCIVKLPKMPFGKHLDYNQNDKFALRHIFRKNDLSENQQKQDDLSQITKKFRLQEKKNLSAKRNKTGHARNRYSKNYEIFDMEHGSLKCIKENYVLKGYKNDKDRYKKYCYEEKNSSQGPISIKRATKQEQELSVERLHNSFKAIESNLSQFFKTKYSGLFEKSSARPITFNFLNTSQNL